MDKQKILNALSNWILRVTDDRTPATPEEYLVLPGIAALVLNYEEEFSALDLDSAVRDAVLTAANK